MKQKEFKEKMPRCAEFIESLCAVFGEEAIHAQIRKGVNGAPTFFAQENGYEIGTRVVSGKGITWHPITGCAIDVEKLPRSEYETQPIGESESTYCRPTRHLR